MNETRDYVKVYKKDPFSVSFNVDTMRNGSYLIEGDVTDENWKGACKQINVPEFGKCFIRCIVEKAGNVLNMMGEIKTTMKRTCVRTLKEFPEDEVIKFHERVFIDDRGEDEITVVLHGAILEMKEYLVQQIILNMNSYPIHPDTLSCKKGEFDLNDGQEKAILKEKEEKNPFSVLKDLKSDS
ncbi:MAG: uncharacterized metal-binding protein YceD (DUF177 family) [Alphaproteobacteria bacterium]|jgi:uncharacterized metal-binding protein YceD (DUF177 family)